MNCLVETFPRISRDVWAILADMPEGELDIHHHGLGLYLREHVLMPDSELYKLFIREGVTQKEDMSAQIIRCWHEVLKSQKNESCPSSFTEQEQPQNYIWKVTRMGATGIVRAIDELGRIVLPVETRSKFGLKEKDGVEIFTDEAGIYLKPIDNERCIFCAEKAGLIPHSGRYICRACLTKINELSVEK